MSSSVKSAERTMQVLQVLAGAGGPMTTQAISAACAMPKSSAHHLLNVMRDHGFLLYREPERQWTLGPAVLEIASAYQDSDPLHVEGGRLLADLAGQVGHTAHLAVLRGTEVLYIDKREPSQHAVRLVTEVGSRLPAVSTAVGQAILAFLPETEVEAAFADYDFTALHDDEPQDLARLREQLDRVARRGVAHDVGLITSGISCVASPVFDRHHRPIASIGVTFVTAQVEPSRVEEIMGVVRLVSAQLSFALGSHAPTRPAPTR